MRKKPSSLLPLGEILKQDFTHWKIPSQGIVSSLDAQWSQIVGKSLARQTLPLQAQGKLLRIGVKNSALANELQFLQAEILKKIQTLFPEIEMIRFQIVTRSSG